MIEPVTRYLNRLVKDFRRLDSRGVMQVARLIELELDDVFVDLVLRPLAREFDPASVGRPAADSDNDAMSPDVSALQSLPLEQTSRSLDQLLANSNRWVILGDPGAGKTTLLRRQALNAALTLTDPEQQTPSRLPVFITLRFFGAWLARGNRDQPDALRRYWAEDGLGQWGITDAADRAAFCRYLDERLSDGSVLLVLDGLDEQRDADTRRHTAIAIAELDRRCPGNAWLVSSRVVGYTVDLKDIFKDRFDVAEVLPFMPRDRDGFLRQWLLAVERSEDPSYLLARKQGETVPPDARTLELAAGKAAALIQQIEATPGVASLATNPLLCTIIGLVFLQGGTLPDNRADLYRLCVDTFIFNWEMHKRRRPQEGPQLDRQETLAVLERLAADFHENRPENRALKSDIVRVVADDLREHHGEREPNAQGKAANLFKLISEVAGLLIDRGNDEYGFFHLTLQEYLTARYLTQTRRRMREYVEKYCFDPVHGPRWREVMRLAAIHQGQKDPESAEAFIQCVLDQHPGHDHIMQYSFRFAFMLAMETRLERRFTDGLWERWLSLVEQQPHLGFLWTGVFERAGKVPACPEEVLEKLVGHAKKTDAKDLVLAKLAIQSLAYTGQSKANEILVALLKAGSPLSSTAGLGLEKCAPEILEALLQAPDYDNEFVRKNMDEESTSIIKDELLARLDARDKVRPSLPGALVPVVLNGSSRDRQWSARCLETLEIGAPL